MLMWFILFYMMYVVKAQDANRVGASISEKCSTLLQVPSSMDTFDMLRRTLNVNCFEYYNVGVNRTVMSSIETTYNDAIITAQHYEAAYTANEHVLYAVKAWLNMDAAEPLTKIQRGLKECNSQLLVNFFGAEDVRLVLPTFISSLHYMKSCFQRVFGDATQERTQLLETYATKELAVEHSAEAVREARQTMQDAHDQFELVRVIFERAIDAAFRSVVR